MQLGIENKKAEKFVKISFKAFILFLIIFSFLFVFLKNDVREGERNEKVKVLEKIGERLWLFNIDNKVYVLKEATNQKEWEEGLMFVREPVDYDGMIFIFPEKAERIFWNKNTYLDLEVYWLDDDKILGKDSLESIEKTKEVKFIRSPFPVNRVIEIIKK